VQSPVVDAVGVFDGDGLAVAGGAGVDFDEEYGWLRG